MPQFNPYTRRYNSLRLLGYEYNSIFQLCAITVVTDLRRPVFADVRLAKSILGSLLSEQTLSYMRVRAFTLMPDHLHFLAGVQQATSKFPRLYRSIQKLYNTKIYWERSREIVEAGYVELPGTCITKSNFTETRSVLSALVDWRATLRPEVVRLNNWPAAKPGHLLKKHLWQFRFFDHVNPKR